MGGNSSRSVLSLCGAFLLACIWFAHRSGESASGVNSETIPDVTPFAAVKESRELFIVIGRGWDSSDGSAYRFVRADGGEWQQVGGVWQVKLGVKGLAWGYGLHPEPPAGEPRGIEGDDRTPAGIFLISRSFGFGEHAFRHPAPGALPHIELHDGVECVDDPQSRYYNQIVDSKLVRRDWSSSEHMSQYDSYELGFDFEHNRSPVRASLGSCEFIHIWAGPKAPTRGCTVLAREHLRELLEWLNADSRPLLVQLPEAKYRELQAPFGLPAIPSRIG